MLNLDDERAVDRIVIESPTLGWKGSVLVLDEPPTAAPDGGRTFEFESSPLAVDDLDQAGRSVLIWITDLGPSNERHRVEISEVTVYSRPVGG